MLGIYPRLLPAFKDLIGRSMSVCPHADIGNDAFARGFSALKGCAAQMGKQHNIGNVKQPRIYRWLMRIDVQPGTGDTTRFQRVNQRVLVDQLPTRAIDDIGIRFHLRDAVGVDDLVGFCR